MPGNGKRPDSPALTRRVRLWALLLFWGIGFAFGSQAPAAAQERPVVRIGVVIDGPWVRNDEIRAEFEGAVHRLLDGQFDIRFPAEKRIQGDWSEERVIEAVLRSSRRYGLDPYLVTAVLLVESDARPWAESGKGAIGLMQVMPYMAEKLPLAGNLATIESNVEAGCYILADNIRRLGEKKGISTYFWGRRIRGVAYLEKVEKARARVRGARSF